MSYLYPIISGIILLVSFNFFGFWFLSFFALIPLFHFIYKESLGIKRVFLGGYIFGFIFLGGVISWFLNTYPLDWAGVENPFTAVLLIILIWLVSSLILSFFIALWAIVFYKIKRKNFADIFLAPFLWILFEYFRSAGFSLFWAGPDSLIGPHWTAGFLGYTLAGNNLLLQIAGIGGIYLLSFAVVFVNIFLYWIINSSAKKRIIYSVLFALIITISLFALNNVKNRAFNISGGNYLKAAVLRTNFTSFFTISEKDFLERLIVVENLLRKIKQDGQNPDIVILPEDLRFLSSIDDRLKGKFLREILGDQEKLVIDSGRAKDGNGAIKSRISYFNTKTETVQHYDKMFLFPNGEYLPYAVSFPAKIIGQGKWVDDFNSFRTYARGEGVLAAEFGNAKIGTLFCLELMSPGLHKSLIDKDAQVLINIASHSAFHGSRALYKQTIDAAKVRAVENNRYFILAGNFTPSFIIDNKGNIIKMSGPKDSIIYNNIRLIDEKSAYNRITSYLRHTLSTN